MSVVLICLSYFININQSPYVNNISVCITAMKHEGKKKKKKKDTYTLVTPERHVSPTSHQPF